MIKISIKLLLLLLLLLLLKKTADDGRKIERKYELMG
jgi:hypothetical protein